MTREPSSDYLIRNVSQYEVDFVIPRFSRDLPLGIDPFLLFKSRDPEYRQLHTILLGFFNHGIATLRAGMRGDARAILDFPEVSEIGLGYASSGRRGSGVGDFIGRMILETLEDSPDLLDRGVRHVEEMQLVSVGIGADRISDITANVIKEYLISYTQRQAELWNIPITSAVPITHAYDSENAVWRDGYFDLPVNPTDNSPILFVPRRIVRALPWINYDDFMRSEFTAYLRAKRIQSRSTRAGKEHVTRIARREIERIDRYISRKEESAAAAQPSTAYLDESERCPESDRFKQILTTLTPGREGAGQYQRLMLEVLNYLFNPELIDGELETRTIDGTERRDIVFMNDSDQSFWSYLRQEHSSFLVMFEAKNTSTLDPTHINQTATYLGDRLGRLGVILTRNDLSEASSEKDLYGL